MSRYTRRRHLLVSYDISDDSRRNAVFKTMKDHGDHVQYSVFLCQLDRREVVELTAILGTLIDHREDQIMVIDLGPATHDLTESLTTIGCAYSPPGRRFIV